MKLVPTPRGETPLEKTGYDYCHTLNEAAIEAGKNGDIHLVVRLVSEMRRTERLLRFLVR